MKKQQNKYMHNKNEKKVYFNTKIVTALSTNINTVNSLHCYKN